MAKYLYNKDGSYNKNMVKELLKLAADKENFEIVPSDSEGFMKWLKSPLKKKRKTKSDE